MIIQPKNAGILLHPTSPQEDAQLTEIGRRTPWRKTRIGAGLEIPDFAWGEVCPKMAPLQPPRPSDALALCQLPPTCRPYPFQAQDIARMLHPSGWGQWGDLGTGKTLCALAAYWLLKRAGKVKGLVVIGPEAGRHVWAEDAAKFLGEPVCYVERGKPIPAEGIIYCTFQKVFRPPYGDELILRLRTGEWALCIDEAHLIGSVNSRRFQTIELWSRFVTYRWLLTGTPVRNWPDSFWALWVFITQGRVSREQWIHWFCPYGKWITTRLRALGEAMRQYSQVRLKSEVAPQLPPITERIIPVKMVGRQRELYDQMITDGMAELATVDGERWKIRAWEFWTRLIYLQSIASHPCIVGDGLGQAPAKLEVLMDVLSWCGDQKALIWSWHPGVLDWLMEQLGKHQCCRYHGQVGKTEKDEAISRFNNDPSCRLFLGNPSSAGISLNLGAGTVSVFWDMQWSWTEYRQALGRFDRDLKRDWALTAYVLQSVGTVEEMCWESVQAKQDLNNLVTGRAVKPQFTQDMPLNVFKRWKARGK